MRLLAIVLQNNKGENIAVATCSGVRLADATKFASIVHQFILESYKNGLRVERYFQLTADVVCACSITKDYILDVMAEPANMFFAYDGRRKLTDYLTRVVKPENFQKRNLELMSILEEFLYNREFSLAEPTFNLRVTPPRRKQVDQELLNRLSYINSEQDKKLLLDAANKQLRIASTDFGLEMCARQAERTFNIKVYDDLHIFEVNRQKQSHVRRYRQSIFRSAMGNRRPKEHKQSEEIILIDEEQPVDQPGRSVIKPQTKQVENQPVAATPQLPQSTPSLTKVSAATASEQIISSAKDIPAVPQVKSQEQEAKVVEVKQALKPVVPSPAPTPKLDAQTAQESTHPSTQSTSTVRLKMNEKLQLATHDGKVKNVNQYGQIVVESNAAQTVRISLVSDLWHNKKVVMTRITPNSFKINPLSDSRFEVQILQPNKGKGVIDYFILKESFNEDKIPLMFIYSQDSRKINNESVVEYIFKYKVNDKWKEPLHDIQIDVLIDQNFIFSDCKTTPLANSLQGKRVNWKAKHLAENAKGKLSLTFIDGNLGVKDIIKEVRLHMRSERSLIKELGVSCQHEHGKAPLKRNLIVQYKILPN